MNYYSTIHCWSWSISWMEIENWIVNPESKCIKIPMIGNTAKTYKMTCAQTQITPHISAVWSVFAGRCTAWSESLLYTSFDPQHDKTNKMTCAPSEDSDQPGHLRGSLASHSLHNKDSDQTVWMRRLIRVFAWCTCHFVGFVGPLLSSYSRAY